MKVKLIKGLSYMSPSFSCKKGTAATVDDEKGKKLLATGRFEEVKETAVTEQVPDGEESNDKQSSTELSAEIIEKMKKPELEALAAEKGIDISACSNNEERAEKIKGELGLVNFATLFGE